MEIMACIDGLIDHAVACGLAEPVDRRVLVNRLLDLLGLEEYVPCEAKHGGNMEDILHDMTDYAVQAGICEPGVTAGDLFDTRIMGALTPMPREVIRTFWEKYAASPQAATDWYYRFSGDTNYIRRNRIARDIRWKYASRYGELEMTINLSKPEKDPRAIAAARNAPQSHYPKCQLCAENEGYTGRMNHPARANHRIIPVEMCGESWYLQYSPYVYYHEHCIVFRETHVPMQIDRAAFEKLLDFVRIFPHYFVGSNADLPIVGGSILSHEHFQGGRYTFAMETASAERELCFRGYEDVRAEMVKWPMSVIRLRGAESRRLTGLAQRILDVWRGHSDPECGIVACSQGEPHNTVTPIARWKDGLFELDLVLRCNITTPEHPLGVFHPHADKHHIKKENIGLIEVMGLAVLPSRLKEELTRLAGALVSGSDISRDAMLASHANWVQELRQRYRFTEDNALDILLRETGKVFEGVLEDAGVYKNTPEGRAGFERLIEAVNQTLK